MYASAKSSLHRYKDSKFQLQQKAVNVAAHGPTDHDELLQIWTQA